jgi:hypothetical protein
MVGISGVRDLGVWLLVGGGGGGGGGRTEPGPAVQQADVHVYYLSYAAPFLSYAAN